MTTDLQHKIEKIINRNPQANDWEITSQLKQLLYEIDLQNHTDREIQNITDVVAQNIHLLKGETDKVNFIKTGFDDFDTRFGGFHLGEFVVVGARPGMGKTQLLVNLSLNISLTHPVLFVTLDLAEFLLTSRFISSVSEIPAEKILMHKLNEEEKEKISTIGGEFTKRQLFLHDCGNSSIAALKANCEKQIRENGIQVIIVDYLQRLSYYKQRNKRELEINYICRELKNMANEHNVCVIASSQLSREVERRSGWKRPLLTDLRDSGAIEQEADKVLFIYRPEYYGFSVFEDDTPAYGLAEIMVQKNRIGDLGVFRLWMDKNCLNFRNNKNKITFSSNRLRELELEELEKEAFQYLTEVIPY